MGRSSMPRWPVWVRFIEPLPASLSPDGSWTPGVYLFAVEASPGDATTGWFALELRRVHVR